MITRIETVFVGYLRRKKGEVLPFTGGETAPYA